jgi:hypothetical protein
VATPKKEWQKGVNRKDKIEPYQVEELELTTK